jgi:aminoglycoside phosphotransferase (APT) family kinase protein
MPAEVDAALAAALASQPGRLGPLGETALWARLDTDRGRADVVELAAQALAERLHRLGPERSVLVGRTHGDLHAGNVLLAAAGPAVLIDWNRSEAVNPLLLDAVYAAVRQHGRRTGGSLAASLVDYLEGRIAGQLARHAARTVGDLTRIEAAALVVLDRVASYSLPRGRHKPWTLPPLRQAVDVVNARLSG